MEKDDLRVFMRESAKTEEIVTAPGPDTILGKDGKPVELKIRILSQETLNKINDAYKRRSVATDKKGNPYISGGEVAFKTERDNNKASQHIIAEALVYPNLKDQELMAFFNCNDIAEMPLKVFPRPDEYMHVSRAVMAALGILDEPDEETKKEAFDEAKN